MTAKKISTLNAPGRLAPHDEAFQKLADLGADIICAQEHTDKDDWRPKGWERYRPTSAQSNTIYWNPATVDAGERGSHQLSSPGFESYREAVWVRFGDVRVISVHLPAFYASRPGRKEEYDKQVQRLLDFIEPGDVIGGDFNGSVGGKRMAPLVEALDFSDPKPTGPGGAKIDYVAATSPYVTGETRLVRVPSSDHDAVIVVVEGGSMVNPVPGYTITTPYGRAGSLWRACGWHTGVDFAAPKGARVVAAIDGQIRHRNYGSAFGRYQFAISPDPGQPFGEGEVFYAHTLDRLPDGTRVKAGDTVARVGAEGNVTGAHLHFELHTTKNAWRCSIMRDPAPAIAAGDGTTIDWQFPKGHKVYQKYLKWKGHEQNPDDVSDSIKAWQEMLNHISIDGGEELPLTGKWLEMTADETQKHQAQFVPPPDSPLEAVFVGPKQFDTAKRQTDCPYVWVADTAPPPVPEPERPPAGAMHGIDISSHQAGINLAAVPAAFVVVKASEGRSYKSPTLDEQYAGAKEAGRLLGLYHFARPDNNGPLEEADWFLACCDSVGGIGEAVLVLDWEREPMDDVAWVTAFVGRVWDKARVRTMVYMSESATKRANWSTVGEVSPLWVAKYSQTEPSVKWPGGWTAWQWTSEWQHSAYDGDLDHNTSKIGPDEWRELAAPEPKPEPPDPEPEESKDSELREVLTTHLRAMADDIEELG